MAHIMNMTKADLFSLKGKTVLLTGATGHLGQAMAQALCAAGAHVLVNSRDATRAQDVVDQLLAQHGSAAPLVFDVTDAGQVTTALASLGQQPLHVIINNAHMGAGGTIQTASAQQYRQGYELSVVAAHQLLCAALPLLKRAIEQDGDASVINIASMYGMVSPDPRVYDTPAATNPPFYGAAKAALIQWTRYAACEFGVHGLRVNSISPGPFPSEPVQQSAPDFVTRLAQRVPMGRIAQATEIQGPVVFLASAASSFVNGTNLVVDGGWTAW